MTFDWRGKGLILLQQQLQALALPPTLTASEAGLAPDSVTWAVAQGPTFTWLSALLSTI